MEGVAFSAAVTDVMSHSLPQSQVQKHMSARNSRHLVELTGLVGQDVVLVGDMASGVGGNLEATLAVTSKLLVRHCTARHIRAVCKSVSKQSQVSYRFFFIWAWETRLLKDSFTSRGRSKAEVAMNPKRKFLGEAFRY